MEKILTAEEYTNYLNDIAEQAIKEDTHFFCQILKEIGVEARVENDWVYAECRRCKCKCGFKVENRPSVLFWKCFNPECKSARFSRLTGFLPFITGRSLPECNNALADALFNPFPPTTQIINCQTMKFDGKPFNEFPPHKLLWMLKCLPNIYNREEIID